MQWKELNKIINIWLDIVLHGAFLFLICSTNTK